MLHRQQAKKQKASSNLTQVWSAIGICFRHIAIFHFNTSISRMHNINVVSKEQLSYTFDVKTILFAIWGALYDAVLVLCCLNEMYLIAVHVMERSCSCLYGRQAHFSCCQMWEHLCFCRSHLHKHVGHSVDRIRSEARVWWALAMTDGYDEPSHWHLHLPQKNKNKSPQQLTGKRFSA